MITGDTSLKIMADEWALLRLSWLYARAMDRNEPDTLAAIFVPDAKLEGTGSRSRALNRSSTCQRV